MSECHRAESYLRLSGCWSCLNLMRGRTVSTSTQTSSSNSIHLLACHRADVTYGVIAYAELGCAVQHWVNVQARRRRFAAELAKPMHQLLLQLIREIVLRAEEHDATLRY